ncbi:MAG TPA: hypothetical protein VI306_03395 [Pyrinomonadaceae bacterium]
MAKHSGNGHQTETPDVSHIRNVEVTHEKSDINVNGVLSFVIALTILTIGVYLGVLLLFNQFQSQAAKEPGPGPMALSQEERLPPEPRLQAAPGFGVTLGDGTKVNLETKEPQAEYRTLRDEWDRNLRGELKDTSGKPLSIPITEAIKKVVSGSGLPSRPVEGQHKLEDFAISVPTAASSGRVTEQRAGGYLKN